MKRGPGRIARALELSGSMGDIATEVMLNLQEPAASQALINDSQLGMGERDHGVSSVAVCQRLSRGGIATEILEVLQ